MSNSTIAWILAILATIAAAVGIYFWQDASSNAEALQQQVSELTNERRTLRSDVRRLESDATLSQQRLNSLESRLEGQQQSDSEQLQQLTADLRASETARQRLQSTTETLQQQIAELEQQLATAPQDQSAQLSELQGSLEQAQVRIVELEQTLATEDNSQVLSEQLTELQENLTLAQERIAQLESDASEAGQTISQLSQENAELTAQIEDKQAELVDLREVAERIDSARNQASAAEQTLQTLNQQLAAKDAALAEREDEITQLQAELNDDSQTTEAISALDAELAQLNEERSMLQAEQTVAQQALDSARSRINELLEQNEQYAEQLNSLQGELDAQNLARQELVSQLEDLSDEKASLVERYEDGRTLISIPTELLYGSGTAEISERGEQALSAVANSIKAFNGYTISIEGHSDSRPIGDKLRIYYPSNWELSSARASSAVRKLSSYGVDTKRMRAVGHAANMPVASNNSASGRAQNRRIEILLVPSVEPIIVTPN